jgi:hypothetical protein
MYIYLDVVTVKIYRRETKYQAGAVRSTVMARGLYFVRKPYSLTQGSLGINL